MPSIPICTRAELERSRSITRWIEELRDEIVLLWLDGGAVAYSSVCPHFGGPLEPRFREGSLYCPWHGWTFDLAEGRCLTHTMKSPIRRYGVIERDGQLEIAYAEDGP